jgi:hypothetical protein
MARQKCDTPLLLSHVPVALSVTEQLSPIKPVPSFGFKPTSEASGLDSETPEKFKVPVGCRVELQSLM